MDENLISMLKINIKASSVSNLTDARYFSALEVQWLGFSLTEGDDFVSPTVVKAIKEWLEGPFFVGEFGIEDAETIGNMVQNIGLDAIQVPIFYTESLSAIDVPIFKEIVIDKSLPASELQTLITDNIDSTTYFIIDFQKNNIAWKSILLSENINIDLLQRLCQQHKILLSIDCNPKEINSILQAIQPHGLCVRGGEEEAVGVKAFDDLQDWFDVLED
jgi:phosphoribosylanthranilate isomerase